MEAFADEAFRLWMQERLPHSEIATRVGVTRNTVARWAQANRWVERRLEEAKVHREKVAEDLFVSLGSAVEETYSAVTKMASRMVAFVLCGGEYCPHCGRGEDSGHPLQRANESDSEYAVRKAILGRDPTFKIRPKDVVDLMKFRMELLQAHGKGGAAGAGADQTSYPPHVVKALADAWARSHGMVPKIADDVAALRSRVETLEAFAERAKAEFGEERVAPLLRVA